MLWPLEHRAPPAQPLSGTCLVVIASSSILATAGQARRRRFVNAFHDERVDDLDGGVSVLAVHFLELADAFAQAHVLHAVLGGAARPAEQQFVISVSASGRAFPLS